MNIGILEEIMQTVTVYTGPYCPYCTMAKRLLQAVGVKEINEIRIDGNPEFCRMQQLPASAACRRFLSATPHVGGFTDLYRLQQEASWTNY